MFLTTAAIIVETTALWEELQASLKDFPLRVVIERTDMGEWSSFAERVERLTPDVMFLEVSKIKDVSGTIRALRALPHAPMVFALHTHAEPIVILEAIRAGASEFLFPPFGDLLQTALERMSTERRNRGESLRPGAKVLGFLSAKGGCGATTIACHTAVELPRQSNVKVLVADMDLDAGMVSFLLKSKSPYSLLDAAQNVHRLDPSYWKALVSNGVPGVEMMAAPGVATGRQNVQPEQIEAVLRFVRTQYDWAIIDLGRGLNKLSLSVLQNCDEAFIVTTTEIPALHQAQQIVNRLITSGYSGEQLHIILNRPPKRMEVSVGELEKMLSSPVYFIIPNDYASMTDSYADGKLLAPDTRVGRSFSELARKIAGVRTELAKKRFSLFG